MQDKYKFKV